jgi:histone H3
MARTKGQAVRTKPSSSSKKDEAVTPSSAVQSTVKVLEKKRKKHSSKLEDRKYRKDVLDLSKRTDSLVPKAPFQRLVREIAQDFRQDSRFTGEALFALQEASEHYLTEMFGGAAMLAMHAGRMGVKKSDMALSLLMAKEHDAANAIHRPGLKRMINNPNKRKHAVSVSVVHEVPKTEASQPLPVDV